MSSQGASVSPAVPATAPQGALSLVSTLVTLTPQTNQQVFVSATADLGTPSDALSGYAIQLFICYAPTGQTNYSRFEDENSIQTNGTIILNGGGMFEFSRSGLSEQGELSASQSYDFGLCAVQTRGTTGTAWESSFGQGSANGQSKVVAMSFTTAVP
jgi:hypothetical protein